MLWQKDAPSANVIVRGARVLDPAEGVDATLEVRIDRGTIVDVAEKVDANEHRVIDAAGLVVRMAVLYDVLTGGPVGVQALAAAEVA